jgi:pyrroline-5-carboxylate reductase
MAEALVRGVLRAGLVPAERIAVSDPDPSRREVFESLGVRAAEENAVVLESTDVVVLAVKPQVLADVLEGLKGRARPDHLFVSIAAGVPTPAIESRLPEGSRVVRVMPNTPMQVGKGAACLARGRHATDEDMRVAVELFETSGVAFEVAEPDLDAVTAVSGSGPAYAFFLAECMIEAAVAEGLTPGLARGLAAATIEGAGTFLGAGREDAAELRRRVTSPGGTTQAAFERLDEAGVRRTFVSAIRRAAERSRELARGG